MGVASLQAAVHMPTLLHTEAWGGMTITMMVSSSGIQQCNTVCHWEYCYIH